MNLSQKCQYALRSLFELARRSGQGPISVGEIAEAQAIPQRFLELILNELKHAGFVASRRGPHGGYMLAMSSDTISVGDVIRFTDGPIAPVRCVASDKQQAEDCPLNGSCAFMGLWERARDATSAIYDGTFLQDLVREQEASDAKHVPTYCI